MTRRYEGDSVFGEPHMRGESFGVDPSEAKVERAARAPRGEAADQERMDHAVYDEPTFSSELSPEAAREAVTYADWLAGKRAAMRPTESWAIAMLMALAAGPLAVIGAIFMTGQAGTWGVLAAIIAAPLVEELMKIALPLWAVERRPWLFTSRLQIAMTAIAGGLAFAAIENAIYLKVYIADPSPGIIAWRWTVCVALHVGCALVSSLGLMKVWSATWRTGRRPQIADAAGHIIAAMVIHGAYNALATGLALSDYHF